MHVMYRFCHLKLARNEQDIKPLRSLIVCTFHAVVPLLANTMNKPSIYFIVHCKTMHNWIKCRKVSNQSLHSNDMS